jgi:signal transduction histidine kinase
LIDSDPDSRALLRDLLAPLARVDEVASGSEGLQRATTRELAAILIDVHLPDGDGFAIVTELRRSPIARNVPVLFLTHTPPDWLTERRGYALGAAGYLTKPVDADALRAKLEVLLTLFRHGVELRRREQMIARQHAEILAAQAALEQVSAANRAKDLYMGVLGHDLRSPLGAILMSSRMMLMRQTLAPDDRESVARIARNGERMAALIRDILDYTRGQALGGIPVVPRSTHMGEICQAMLDEVALLHPDRTMHFECSGELRGMWDRERVEQVISNLLTNALHHGTGEIRIRAEGVAAEVCVSVQNHGKPIPGEQIARLFEPFRRGSGSSVGLGLGLYIVSEIMRAHDGSVDVVSSKETGTIFRTRWPRVPTL